MTQSEKKVKKILLTIIKEHEETSYMRQNLTRPISPCVTQTKGSQSYPIKQNNAHTSDLSRFVGHNLRLWKQIVTVSIAFNFAVCFLTF